MTVFRDPLGLSIFDADHDELEERWITFGVSSVSKLLLVVHTHVEMGQDETLIRIISARRPTRREERQYEQAIAP